MGLAASGCNVIIHHGSSPDDAETAAAEARSLGVRASTLAVDLAVDPQRAFDEVDQPEPVTILVNSAAAFPADTLLDVDRDSLERTMALNLVAPVLLTQSFARQLGDAEGVVVNVTDWRTARPYVDHFSYTLSKGAIDTFTLAAALSLAPRVRVNAVALGAILPPPGRDAAYLADLASDIPLRRPGGVEPVVDAVLSLIRNDYVTGETLRVDGGAHLT